MKKILLSTLLLSLPFMSDAQQLFSTPDEAANAFAAAVADQNEARLAAVLGDDWRQFLPQEEVDPEAIARFNRDWAVKHEVVEQADVAHLNVGDDSWQLPIPIVKIAAGWHFDMSAAQEEILTRAIGRNELSAIEAMHAYVNAQYDYRQRKQVYATRLISSEGQQDGLYWPVQPGETPSPLGPAFSPGEPGIGYYGYHFRIIQSDSAKGFALLAWPVEWQKTGVMSFMVNQDDRIYQADLGSNTATQAAATKQFSPNAPWQAVE
ncbi:DUF2950 family protein [Pseudescherichia sp.]|uniref:DUF2950 family protein n=1 Tax=Pseudescherichia sp. TaxID=2055881 RepID=UPI0028ACC55C|nr:DUF2950 family protein [Pseudescherichia sp.]